MDLNVGVGGCSVSRNITVKKIKLLMFSEFVQSSVLFHNVSRILNVVFEMKNFYNFVTSFSNQVCQYKTTFVLNLQFADTY